jgi:glycosyltransferase involved in cell wall biosynthesis
MKVLFICKYAPEFSENMASFNRDLVENLRANGIRIELYMKRGSGIKGYIKGIWQIRSIVKKGDYDLIHSVYTLSSVLACFQFKLPIVSSFIGTDINGHWQRILSTSFVLKRSDAAIFVSQSLFELAGKPIIGKVIPFGINLKKFFPLEKNKCREIMKLDPNKIYILFASRFDRPEKNAKLAIEAISLLNRKDIELIELKNIPDDKINILYNVCDLLLLTSLSEGSPQVIKEAMACNIPIVSADVGDVKFIMGDTPGNFITGYEPANVVEKIQSAIEFAQTKGKTNSRQRIQELGLDSHSISMRIIDIYKSVLKPVKDL